LDLGLLNVVATAACLRSPRSAVYPVSHERKEEEEDTSFQGMMAVARTAVMTAPPSKLTLGERLAHTRDGATRFAAMFVDSVAQQILRRSEKKTCHLCALSGPKGGCYHLSI